MVNHVIQHLRCITPNEFDSEFNIIVSDSEDECSICQSVMHEFIRTDCGHKFHKECLKKWLFASRRCKTDCPMCRQDIKTKNTKVVDAINDIKQDFDKLIQDFQRFFAEIEPPTIEIIFTDD